MAMMKKIRNISIFWEIYVILLILAGCASNGHNMICTAGITSAPINSANSYFEAYFIDVGQADSTLVVCDDQSLLIDGGNSEDSRLIVAYLKNHNVTSLDYMICTHSHEDHIGGLLAPLSIMDVKHIYAPEIVGDSELYSKFQLKAAEQEQRVIHPKTGDKINLGSSVLEFFVPTTGNNDDLNNTSLICKIIYGNTSFLFTGDAELEAEHDIISQECDVKADVLKVGHHGSDTSTSYYFLRNVMPKYAVISVGRNNLYGHPSETVLSRLRDAGTTVFRTDIQGDITAISDGTNITIKTEKNENNLINPPLTDAVQGYIGNIKSKKFHKSDCNSLPAENNRVYFDNRDEAVSEGFTPCGLCNP